MTCVPSSNNFCSDCQHFMPGNNKLAEGNCRSCVKRHVKSARLPTDGWTCIYFEPLETFPVKSGPEVSPYNKGTAKPKEETQKHQQKRPATVTAKPVKQPTKLAVPNVIHVEGVTATGAEVATKEKQAKSHKAKANQADAIAVLAGHYRESEKVEITMVQLDRLISSARELSRSGERLRSRLSDLAVKKVEVKDSNPIELEEEDSD